MYRPPPQRPPHPPSRAARARPTGRAGLRCGPARTRPAQRDQRPSARPCHLRDPGGLRPARTSPPTRTLSPVVAKLFNASAANVPVSFQVLHNPDEVVTVFTDKSTGKEIIQFPSQALIALAEMYDKDAGKVLDKSV